jgi:mono/diheme cytochrome c family protein
MLRKLLVGLALVAVVALGVAAFYVASRQNLRFDAPYPSLPAAADSAVLARGHYVVRDLASCGACHGDPRRVEDYRNGVDVPLSGGRSWAIPPGKFFARNLTPDPETGTGSIADSSLARALRFGVGHDGRALLPFMEMQGLSDQDLAAVVAYLRAQPAVRNAVPAHRVNLLGMVLRATVLSSPVGPSAAPPATSPRGATVENGRYLVESVARCSGCHTQRDVRTGAFIGAPLAGAKGFEDPDSPGRSWSPPNITSGGRLKSMDEAAFLSRMRAGRAIPDSPMPWQGYQRMDEDDLRAIFRYLVTVPASSQDVGPPVLGTRQP